MTCQSCIAKWTQYYLNKGFPQDTFLRRLFHRKTALKMAKNLVERVERRLERENKAYEPMYLLEKSKEGVILLYRNPKSVTSLFRWCFLTQWRATILQSFKHHKIFWIGKGFNPDYTIACNACAAPSGTCAKGEDCSVALDCREIGGLACATPACSSSPLANSTCTNACVCTVGGCACVLKKCGVTAGTCTLSGICNCNCNSGYRWNGSACVLAPKAKAGLHPSKILPLILNE